MALEICHRCGKSYEISRHGTRTERQSVDAAGNTWHIVTSDAWVVHQCRTPEPEPTTDPRTHLPRDKEPS